VEKESLAEEPSANATEVAAASSQSPPPPEEECVRRVVRTHAAQCPAEEESEWSA
jgi:hypothetical protein